MSEPAEARNNFYISADRLRYIERRTHTDSPEERIERMTTNGSDAFLQSVLEYHLELWSSSYGTPRMGPGVIKSVYDDGTYSHLGLDYRSDFEGYLAPSVTELSQEIADSGLDEQEKLRRLANIAGVLLAESQLFSDSNKRTARAFYGRIRYGAEFVNPILNARLNFTPPQNVEDLILQQNVQRLITGFPDAEYSELPGGITIDAETISSLTLARFNVDLLRMSYGRSTIQHLEDAAFNRVRLEHAIRPVLPDDNTRDGFITTLFQRDYGPAAFSLIFATPYDYDLLDTDKARAFIDVGRTLLRMRITSLVTELASGGRFVMLEPASNASKEKQLQELYWEPGEPVLAA